MRIVNFNITKAGHEEDIYMNIETITHFQGTKDEQRTAIFLVNKEQAITVNHTPQEVVDMLESEI